MPTNTPPTTELSPRTVPGRPARGVEPPCKRYHHGDLRRCLLDAAQKLIAERGVLGTSLREVARRAGVTNRAPYHHFADKNALLIELAKDGFAQLYEGMAKHREIPDLEDRLTLQGLAYVSFAENNPGTFQTMWWSELCEETAFPDREQVASPAFELLLEILCVVARRSEPDVEMERIGIAGWSLVHGFATLQAQCAIHPRDAEPLELATDITRRAARMMIHEATLARLRSEPALSPPATF